LGAPRFLTVFIFFCPPLLTLQTLEAQAAEAAAFDATLREARRRHGLADPPIDGVASASASSEGRAAPGARPPLLAKSASKLGTLHDLASVQ